MSLEQDYADYRALLTWVKACPSAQLQARYAYLKTRQNTFERRLGLLTGGIERLGMLPIIVALYFQFKDVQWWPLEFDLKNVILAGFVAVVYAMCLWITRFKLRLDMYVLVLGDALGDHHGESGKLD